MILPKNKILSSPLAIIALVVITLLVIICVGAYLVYVLVIGKRSVEPTLTNSSATKFITADWFTYVGSISDDVTFKYPQDWEVDSTSTFIFQGPEVKEIIISSKVNQYRFVLKKTSSEDKSKYSSSKRYQSNIKTRDGLTFKREYILAAEDKENIFKYSAILKSNNQEYLFYSVGGKNLNEKSEITTLDSILSTISFRVSNEDLENYRNYKDQIEGVATYSSVDLGLDFKYDKASTKLTESIDSSRHVTALELIDKKDFINTLTVSRILDTSIEKYIKSMPENDSNFKKIDDKKIGNQLRQAYQYNSSSSESDIDDLINYLYLIEHNNYLYILTESVADNQGSLENLENIFTTLEFNNKINYQVISSGCCEENSIGRKNYIISNQADWQDLWLKLHPNQIPKALLTDDDRLPFIDFTKKTIAAVFYDKGLSTVWAINAQNLINVDSIIEQNNKVELNANIITKNQDCESTEGSESPYLIITIDKANAEINFNINESVENCD